MLSWSMSTASAGISTCWLVIRLSPNVELSKLLMAVITFWFELLHKSLSWSLLLMKSAKFRFDMTSIYQQGSCWKDREMVEFFYARIEKILRRYYQKLIFLSMKKTRRSRTWLKNQETRKRPTWKLILTMIISNVKEMLEGDGWN